MGARKEIYQYKAPWPIYGMGWSQRDDGKMRLAIGSFVEEYNNKIQVVQFNEGLDKLEMVKQVDHPYPTTKIMWIPDKENKMPDLFATTGDYLRIWRVSDDSTNVSMECLLNNNKSSEFCAPLTSFDWNEINNHIIGTSSIDTTCTIWNIETGAAIKTSGTVNTQLIAHDTEVFDIAFSDHVDIFASTGADGSVRTFDLRSLEHSTIIYETEQKKPLLRLAWNKQDGNYLATINMDSNNVVILDNRMPCVAVAQLDAHEASVNGISWAPMSASHICSAADDKKAMIWDISKIPKVEAILAYDAGGPINQVQWSARHTEYVSICYDNTLEVLHV